MKVVKILAFILFIFLLVGLAIYIIFDPFPIVIDDLIAFSLSAGPIVGLIKCRPRKECVVDKHITKLPNGYHASPEKVRTAKENGFDLDTNHTWVKTYTRKS